MMDDGRCIVILSEVREAAEVEGAILNAELVFFLTHLVSPNEETYPMSFRRTIRASVPVALTWGVGWAIFTFLLTTYNAWRFARLGYHTSGVVDHLYQAGFGFAFGTLGGLIFSALLARAERGGEVGKISHFRVALWGALTGLCFVPALLGLRMIMVGEGVAVQEIARMCLWFAGYGATSGLAMLALARKGAPPGPNPLAELGSDFTVAEFVEERLRKTARQD